MGMFSTTLSFPFFTPAMILSLGTLGSYLLGIGRDILFAHIYGTSGVTDAYFTAFLISDIFLMIFVSSALLGIAIPLFLQTREKNREEGYRTYGIFFTSINTVFLVVCVLGVFFAPFFLSFLPQYAHNPTEFVSLTQLFFLSNFFFGLSNFIGSFLMAHRYFLSTALSPLFYNFGIIGGMWGWHESLGIYGAGLGAVVGAMLHLGVRFLEYRSQKDRFPLHFEWGNASLKVLVSSMVFRWCTVAMFPVMMFCLSFFASSMQEGLYTLFGYLRNVESAPVAIFGSAIATSIFPVLSQYFAQSQLDQFGKVFWKSCGKVLFWTIPIGIGIWFCGSAFVQVVYGIETPESLQSLSVMVPILALVVPFESINTLFARTFNSLGDTKTPLVIAIVSLGFLLSLLFVFSFFYEVLPARALALSYTGTFMLSSGLSFFFLFRKKEVSFGAVQNIRDSSFFPFREFFMAMGAMTIVLWWGSILINTPFFLGMGLPLCGIFVFFGMLFLFWKKELLKKLKTLL